MKIGVVGPFSGAVGGVAVQAVRLVDALRSEGLDVIRIPDRVLGGGLIDRIPVARTIRDYAQRQRRFGDVVPDLDGLIVMSCSGWQFRLVVEQAVACCHGAGVPVVVSHRGAMSEAFLKRQGPRVRRVARVAAGVHASSEWLAQTMRAVGITCRAAPIIVDLADVDYRSRDPHVRNIVCTRTLEKFHGGPVLVHALAEIARRRPDVRVTVTGSGPDLARCRRLADRLGVRERISFVGVLSRQELAGLLDRATLMLNTSTADNMPNAILEAFASGVPVVSSDPGGIPDLLGHGSRGRLVTSPGACAVADAVEQTVSDAVGARRRAVTARRWIEGLTWARQRRCQLAALVEPLRKAHARGGPDS